MSTAPRRQPLGQASSNSVDWSSAHEGFGSPAKVLPERADEREEDALSIARNAAQVIEALEAEVTAER